MTPTTFTVDMNNISDTQGPHFIGISAWVTTADATAGLLNYTMDYLDPTTTARQVAFGVSPQLVLSDATSFFATDMCMLSKLSGTSLWTFTQTLVAGIGGVARISYRIFASSAAGPDLQQW